MPGTRPDLADERMEAEFGLVDLSFNRSAEFAQCAADRLLQTRALAKGPAIETERGCATWSISQQDFDRIRPQIDKAGRALHDQSIRRVLRDCPPLRICSGTRARGRSVSAGHAYRECVGCFRGPCARRIRHRQKLSRPCRRTRVVRRVVVETVKPLEQCCPLGRRNGRA